VGSPWPYTQPTWVFSTRPVALLKGNDIRIARGDLAGQFYDARLLNEIIVQIGSVTLGRGKQLFPRRVTNPPLRLISTQQIASGFADLRYEVQTGQVSEDAATGG
jgi:dihydrofolate reductase